MIYSYFVSYFGVEKNGKFGFGRTDITRNKIIETIDDIESMEKLLKELNKSESIVVLSYQLFRTHKEE